MKKSFTYCFCVLFISLISMQVLICSEDKKAPDTQTGIAYQVLFEQRLPLLDKAVDPNNIAETIATMLMISRFEAAIKSDNSLLAKTFDNKTSVEKQLAKTKKIALKKIKTAIERIIDENIINIIEKQSKLFETHGKKGFIGKTIDSARGWFAKKLSKKALKDYKDFEFRHVSPAYTDAAPGLLKNNLEFLYEEIGTIVLASRKVGDLFALYVFFNQEKDNFLASKIQHIQTSNQKLRQTLQIYINELDKQSFETRKDLLFFAQKYQADASTILQTICTYLNEVAKNASARAKQANFLSSENINNFLTFFILPSSFLDTDVVTYTNTMASDIKFLKTQKNLSEQDLALAVKDKLAAQQKNGVLSLENKDLKEEIAQLKKELANLKKTKSSKKDDKPIIIAKNNPVQIPYQANVQPSQIRTNLLNLHKQLDSANNIPKVEKIKQEFSNLQQPTGNDANPDLTLYNQIEQSIKNKINNYIQNNITQLDKAAEQIQNATALDQLTELESKINELKLSSDQNSADRKKKAEIMKQLQTKTGTLQSKK